MEKELWHGVEAGSDSDFTGLLAVLWEMGQVWAGSRSPAQLVGVPAVVNCSVPALFLPHLECWLPSTLYMALLWEFTGITVKQVLLGGCGLGMPEGRTEES